MSQSRSDFETKKEKALTEAKAAIAAGKMPDVNQNYTYKVWVDDYDRPTGGSSSVGAPPPNVYGDDFYEWHESQGRQEYEQKEVEEYRLLFDTTDRCDLIRHALQKDQPGIAQQLINDLRGTPAVKFNMLLGVYIANKDEQASELSANFILQFAKQVLANQGQHMSVDKLNQVGADLREVFPNNDDIGRLCEEINALAITQQAEVDRIARERQERRARAQEERQRTGRNAAVEEIRSLLTELEGKTKKKAESAKASKTTPKIVREQAEAHHQAVKGALEAIPKGTDNYSAADLSIAMGAVRDARDKIHDQVETSKSSGKLFAAKKSSTKDQLNSFLNDSRLRKWQQLGAEMPSPPVRPGSRAQGGGRDGDL